MTVEIVRESTVVRLDVLGKLDFEIVVKSRMCPVKEMIH